MKKKKKKKKKKMMMKKKMKMKMKRRRCTHFFLEFKSVVSACMALSAN